MNELQNFGFFVSVGYVFYVLWWKYNYENFFKKRRLILNLFVCICWASFGLTANFSVKNSTFLIPLILIFLIRIFDLLSIRTRNRHFRPCHGKLIPENANITDALLTLVVLLINIFLPEIILNFAINGKFFD
jgi:hypothetical protein